MSIEEQDEGLAEVVDELNNVDENSPEASLNEDSISDNNGGRIKLDEGELSRTIQGEEN